MKKKLYLLLALLLAAAVIVVGVLFFVNREPQKPAATAPAAPVIGLSDDLSVYWDRVENAESYIIQVNGSDLLSTENTSFSVLSVPGTYVIQVQAVNKAGKSDYSNEVTYETLGVTLPKNELFTVLGNPVVGYGLDYTFTLELAEGCTQCEPVVEVNGQVVTPDAGGKYTVANVTEDLTVTIEGVELNSYPVTLPAGTGYTLRGEPVAYYGKDYSFTLTLEKGYSKSQPVVKANGVELTPHNGSYVLQNVTKPQVITVSGVTINTYTVNLTTGRGYTISPSGVQTVSHGESVKFTVTADSPSYKIAVQADGKTLSADNGAYTIAGITSDVQVTVTVAGLPALSGVETILDPTSWSSSGTVSGNTLTVPANSSLKADYLKALWDEGYTHLVFTVNAQAAADNNTNYTHSGQWSRYWANFDAGKRVDLRIDLNEFHDGDTWYNLNFNAGTMTVSSPRAYKSAETLSWVKNISTTYLAIEDGYYVLETHGNDFGVTSPTQWLKKYVVEDDASQRTWLVYTDYIKQGNNTRSVLWGWGSPVSTLDIGQWTAINNVQIDGYQQGEVFSLVLDRAGVVRFKISDFISNRNTWGTFRYSEVTDNSITFSGAVDQKLRYAATDELIAAGYTHLQVTFSGNIGDSVIYFGNDEWGADKYILGVSKNELTNANNYTYTANVDLSRMNGNLFTLQVAGAAVTDMTVTVKPAVLSTYNVTLPSGVGYTVSGETTAVSGSNYKFSVILNEGYTQSTALVKVGGVVVAGVDGVYTVENVQEDLNITVENVVLNTYTVTKPEGEGYTVSGADSVTHGESYTFSVTASDPEIPLVVLVNGRVVTGTNGVYTVEDVRENLTITAQATMPKPAAPEDILQSDSWTGTVLSADGSSLKLTANASLKAEYLKSLWSAGYTHLVFTVNASSAGNFIHGGTWDRYWGTVNAGTQDLRIDLNEFHDGDSWYDLSFINMSKDMTVSAPKAYKSPETLNWVKNNSSTYFAIEDGYYVLETRGNDFGVTSPTQWLKKYVVKDDAGQRTWLMYTDYITKGNNTRSMIWGWGSPVNTINSNANGGWSFINNVQTDGYTDGEVFSLHLDRAGTARFKLLDWVSDRNEWNSTLDLTYVDEQTIRWSAASDYKLRLATTQDLIAAGYTTLKVTLTGNLGSALIWYGEDDWSDGEIAVGADKFVDGSYTFEVDLTTFKPNENFTIMANAAAFTDLLVKIEPIAE